MLFVILTGNLAVPVKSIGGVPVSGGRQIVCVDKEHRITASCGFRRFFQQRRPVFFRTGNVVLTGKGSAGYIAVFRQHDQIHGRIAGIHQFQFFCKIGVGQGEIHGVGRLDHTGFHRAYLRGLF